MTQEQLTQSVDEMKKAIVYERDQLDNGYFECPLLISDVEELVTAAQQLLDIGKLCDIADDESSKWIRASDVRKILEGR